MFNSLKFKIIITAFLIISTIMITDAWRDIKRSEQLLLNGQREKAVLLSERIAHGIMELMLQNKWQDLQAMVESLVKNAGELKEIRIFRPENGVILVSSDPLEIGAEINKEAPGISGKHEMREAFIVEKGGEQYVLKLSDIKNQPVCHKCHSPEEEVLGVLHIGISLSEITKTIQGYKRKYLTEALVGFILIAGAFVFVVGVLIDRPIKRMTRTIRKIEDGDLSARMDEDKKDELGLMAKSFNSMLESLESAKQEIELCHTEQMQRAAKLASLGEIISGIAHEIKNPLTGISCAVQVLQSEMSEDDEGRMVTSEILNHIRRLDTTVKALLNYARPKPPCLLSLKINDILEKAVFFVQPEANKQNVSIETEIEDDIPDVMMDPDQMQQIFLNLILNAVQAMPEGGNLKIEISVKDYTQVGGEIAGTLACEKILAVTFEDTGLGIKREHMESIFDPFFTKKSKGTGLGLSISQRIVQEHGGEISVKSEVGKGSIFTVYLPIGQSEEQ